MCVCACTILYVCTLHMWVRLCGLPVCWVWWRRRKDEKDAEDDDDAAADDERRMWGTVEGRRGTQKKGPRSLLGLAYPSLLSSYNLERIICPAM